MKEEFNRVQEKVAVAEKTNATKAIGPMLRKKRDAIPSLHAYHHDISVRQQMMGEGG